MSHSRLQYSESIDRTRQVCAIAGVFVVLCLLTTFRTAADDVTQPLSVPVKVLPGASSETAPTVMQNTATGRTRPQPTTPGGKLPQYQLGHHHRTIPAEADLSDPRLRLIFALPSMPVLVDAIITIDGEPYLMARERRIRRILEEVKRPTPVVASEEQAATVSAVADDAPGEESEPVSESAEPVEPQSETAESPESEADSENEPDSEAETESEDEPAAEGNEPEAEPVTPPTVPAYSLPTNVPEQIRRFIAATGEAATVDEVRWFLTNWVDGPVLLMLNDNFQRFRANERPVFNVLDANRDGSISADEVSNAVVAFEKCDFNRNDIIEYTELAKVAADPELRKQQHAGPGKLIFRIPDEKSAVAMYRRIAARYPPPQPGADSVLPRFDANANGKFDAEELAVLRAAQPDLNLTITFNSADPSASRIELTAAGSTMATASTGDRASTNSISLPLGGTIVSFSAVQSGSSDQISIGAVNDGYPILPVIDPNEDGRFTIRERRGLVDSLRKFDQDQDGNLTYDETRATIRICFGLGPLVHRELIALRQINPNSKTPVVVGPDWFVRMDRNQDNDVSRKEFPGKKEHFDELDTDRDELVSAQEALDFDARNSGNESDSSTSASESPEKTTAETAKETE